MYEWVLSVNTEQELGLGNELTVLRLIRCRHNLTQDPVTLKKWNLYYVRSFNHPGRNFSRSQQAQCTEQVFALSSSFSSLNCRCVSSLVEIAVSCVCLLKGGELHAFGNYPAFPGGCCRGSGVCAGVWDWAAEAAGSVTGGRGASKPEDFLVGQVGGAPRGGCQVMGLTYF